MKRNLPVIAVLAWILIVVAGAIWWEFFRWHECRAVGHSRLYCILSK